jgi:DNA-binding transcriptional LysR family regulator
MLSLYKLEIFAIVVKEGSFSAAAERMYMTQSAVSQHMHDLEHSLGATLFKRGRRGVTLTSVGKKLHDYTRRILHLVAEAESAIINVEKLEEGQMSIGSTPGVSVYLLPDWIQAFRQRFPRLTVTMDTAITTEIVARVLDHRLDIGFVEGELDDIHSSRLGDMALRDMHLNIIIGREHDWWDQEAVPLAALNEQPFVTRQPGSRTRTWVDRMLQQQDVQPKIVAELDNPESIKRAVLTGMGVAILPECAVYHELEMGLLQVIPLEDVTLRRTLKLVWDKTAPFSPVSRAFLTSLADEFPQLLNVTTVH